MKTSHHKSFLPSVRFDVRMYDLYFEYVLQLREVIFKEDTAMFFIGLERPNFTQGTIFVIDFHGWYHVPDVTCWQMESDLSQQFAFKLLPSDMHILKVTDTDCKISCLLHSVKIDNIFVQKTRNSLFDMKKMLTYLFSVCDQFGNDLPVQREIPAESVEAFARNVAFIYNVTGNDYVPHMSNGPLWFNRLPQICYILKLCPLPLLTKHGELWKVDISVFALLEVFLSCESLLLGAKKRQSTLKSIMKQICFESVESFRSTVHKLHIQVLQEHEEGIFKFAHEYYMVLTPTQLLEQVNKGERAFNIMDSSTESECRLSPDQVKGVFYELKSGKWKMKFDKEEEIQRYNKQIKFKLKPGCACGKGSKKRGLCKGCKCATVWHRPCGPECGCTPETCLNRSHDGDGYCDMVGTLQEGGPLVYLCDKHPQCKQPAAIQVSSQSKLFSFISARCHLCENFSRKT